MPLSKLSYRLKQKHGFTFNFEKVKGKKVTIRSILITFVDEPDWGMDNELWGFKEYGYGKPRGTSSQAPFHVQYLHEKLMVKTFAAEILEGMVLDRIELFYALTKLAYKTGHKYWAYRFTAWSTHYLQDLCQPYHSNAVPSANFWYYTKLIFSFNIKKIKKETTQLVANRHFLYEDFVAHCLEKSYLINKSLYKQLASFPLSKYK